MNNIDKIRQSLTGQEFDALLITSPANRYFAVGFPSCSGVVLVTKHGAWLLVDSRYYEAACAAVKHAEVRLTTREEPNTCLFIVSSLLKEQGISALGFEDEDLTFAQYQVWKEKIEAQMIPDGGLLKNLRRRKTEGDIQKLKKAQSIAEKTLEEVLPLLGGDITERQLSAELTYRAVRYGADDKSFDPVVVSGARSSLPHGNSGDDRIGEGFVIIDFGVRCDGWCSDMTRTFCIGRPDEEMVRAYETVLEAQKNAIASVRPGVKCPDVDAAARNLIENAGYGKHFGHATGHGLGLEVHEAPTISSRCDDILSVGDVITIEPGIYLPGRFGVRIEDMLIVTEEGMENITKISKGLTIIYTRGRKD